MNLLVTMILMMMIILSHLIQHQSKYVPHKISIFLLTFNKHLFNLQPKFYWFYHLHEYFLCFTNIFYEVYYSWNHITWQEFNHNCLYLSSKIILYYLTLSNYANWIHRSIFYLMCKIRIMYLWYFVNSIVKLFLSILSYSISC